jgi:putative addiction module killer protein
VYDFEMSEHFEDWLEKLKDRSAKLDITARIAQARLGNFGEHKQLKGTGGISEMIINAGPGYRLYYSREGNKIFWLLVGGIKKNQQNDIKRAMNIRKLLQEDGYGPHKKV